MDEPDIGRIGPVFRGDSLQPPYDPTLADLLMQQVEGRLTRYWAAVPLALVRPFDPDYNPSASTTWAPVSRHLITQMRAGTYPNLTTYEVAEAFVTSDDYLAYHAYNEVHPQWVPCYVLGEPRSGRVTAVRLAPEEAARRDADEHGRDFEQSRLLYEYLQRADIAELNGHPRNADPRPNR